MHIKPQPVAGAMHVQVAIGTLFNQSIGITDQQAEIHQTFHQHPQRRGMDLFGRPARLHRLDSRHLGSQHQAVELSLLGREAPVHREGAGDVAVVVVIHRTAGIDQQQITVLQRRGVGGVMQHAGVVAPGHDRAIGGPAGTGRTEMRFDRRLHLGLIHSRAGHRPRQLMGLRRNPAGLAQTVQLMRLLAQPQTMQDRRRRHQTQGS